MKDGNNQWHQQAFKYSFMNNSNKTPVAPAEERLLSLGALHGYSPDENHQRNISTGYENSFSKIYHSHFDLLYCSGMKYTSNTRLIEDSIQNVFVYLLKKKKSFTDVTNVKAYLVKSFRRQLLLDLREQKRFLFSDQLSENLFDDFDGAEQAVSEGEELNKLKRVIKKSMISLPARQKEIIYLRYDCALSYEEISNILKISVDSCYKSVYRSIRILKTRIGQLIAKEANLSTCD